MSRAASDLDITDYLKAKTALQDQRLLQKLRQRGVRRMSQGALGKKLSAHAERHNSEKELAVHAGVSQTTVYRTKKVLAHPDLDSEIVSGQMSLAAAAEIARNRQRVVRAERAKKDLKPIWRNNPGGVINSIMLADVLDGLKRVPDNTVSLVVTSPPYPITAVSYTDHKYNGNYEEYLSWMEQVFRECRRTLRDGGRIAVVFDICHPSDVERRQGAPMILDLRTDFTLKMREIQMSFRGEIVWYKQNPSGSRPMMGSRVRQPRLQRTWEYICLYQKGERGLSGLAKNIDLTDEERNKWSMAKWDIKTIKMGPSYHPCPFPLEIPRRLIKMYSYIGDVVLDPFCGTGTTCYAAQQNGRRWIGIDNSPLYVKHARRRLDQRLCVRPAYAGLQ